LLYYYQIVWDNRYLSQVAGNLCLVSVDGTDFRIPEPSPFNAKWWSHKFNAPAIRYEIAICIQTGHIVWIHGPFPSGEWPDIRIARDALIPSLDENEMYVADEGYVDGNGRAITPSEFGGLWGHQMSVVRGRHETCNGRFKYSNILSRTFRHEKRLHGSVFRAVAVLTQLAFENTEPLFEVVYNETIAF
jgi:hypothetical protein